MIRNTYISLCFVPVLCLLKPFHALARGCTNRLTVSSFSDCIDTKRIKTVRYHEERVLIISKRFDIETTTRPTYLTCHLEFNT